MSSFKYDNLGAGAEVLRDAAALAAQRQVELREDGFPVVPEPEFSQIPQHFTGVPAIFQPFVDMPSPSDFGSLINWLDSGANLLITTQNAPEPGKGKLIRPNEAFAAISNVSTNLASWSGAAANEFRANYLDPLPGQTAGQFNAMAIFSNLIQQEQKVWYETQLNVTALLNDALDCVKGMDRSLSKDGWTLALTATASIATILAPPLAAAGAGVAAATALAVIDGAASMGGAMIPGDEAKVLSDDPPLRMTFTAWTPYILVSEVVRGCEAIIDRAIAQEAKIGAAFNYVADVLHRHRESFVPPQPPMLGNMTPTSMTGADYLGFSS